MDNNTIMMVMNDDDDIDNNYYNNKTLSIKYVVKYKTRFLVNIYLT